MALTNSVVFRTTFGNKKVVVVDTTFDSSYVTGGESLTAADLGLTKIQYVATGVADTNYVTRYDYTNSKLLAYDSDYSTSTDGPLQQVANATDLSTADVRLLVVGY
jgi:hypothetical protein